MAKKGFIGKIDSFHDGFLRGWVFDTARPRQRQCVDVFAGEAFLGQAACGFYRPDLEAAGYGDGRHEFLIQLGEVPAELSDVRVRVTGAPHVVLTLFGEGVEEMPRDDLDEASIKIYFDALLAGLHLGADRVSTQRSEHALLVECSSLHGIPVSHFAIHIAHKFGYDIADEEAVDEFLSFYFERYSPLQAPFKVPLASQETQYWATPRHTACRAAKMFAPPPYRRGLSDSYFAWAYCDAKRLGIEDSWIDSKIITYLQGQDEFFPRSNEFPINRFMRRFLKQHAVFQGLNWKIVEHRQLAYAAVFLHAAYARHLSRFLPQQWLTRLLEVQPSRPDLLSEILSKVLDHQPNLDQIARPNFFKGTPPIDGSQDDFVDVQIVGPFDRILGLSESCRRFAQVIQNSGHRVSLANYDIGNASPFAPFSDISTVLKKARINILHLNLEEIPEALAFSLAGLSDTYLIAIPYYELSAISKCHLLGLKMIDEIWAPTCFLRDLFENAGGTTKLMPLPVAEAGLDRKAARFNVLSRIGHKEFETVFLTTADALSWFSRKFTLGVLDAFQTAFQVEDSVCLILKVHNTENISNVAQMRIWSEIVARAESDKRIILVTETYSAADYRTLLGGVDCLVSLHRSEGLGIDILDAMMLGTAVVATGYSGNVDVCDDETSWLVDFDLVPVQDGDYPFAEAGHVWAEPRLQSAVAGLRDVHTRPSERAVRAANARMRISSHNDPEATQARVSTRLATILSSL